MRARSVVATIALMSLPLLAPQAKMYKWVDEDGNVTYSQVKPPDKEAESVRLRGVRSVTDEEARERLEALNDRADEARKDREFKATHASEVQERETRLKENCEIARQNVRVLQTAARIKAADGSYLDDSARQAQLARNQQQVENNCK